MRAYRAVIAIVAWATLAGQYWLMVSGKAPGEIAGLTINFFSYFTIVVNLLGALAMTLPAFAPGGAGRWWVRPEVRGLITLCFTVVMITYHLLLRNIWDPQGLQKVVDYTLHYGLPIAFILDWLLFTPKGALGWRNAVAWLALPAIYGVWTLIHGAWRGFYPYPFLDVGQLGYPAVLTNMAGFVVAFLLPGLVVVALDRVLGGKATIRGALIAGAVAVAVIMGVWAGWRVLEGHRDNPPVLVQAVEGATQGDSATPPP